MSAFVVGSLCSSASPPFVPDLSSFSLSRSSLSRPPFFSWSLVVGPLVVGLAVLRVPHLSPICRLFRCRVLRCRDHRFFGVSCGRSVCRRSSSSANPPPLLCLFRRRVLRCRDHRSFRGLLRSACRRSSPVVCSSSRGRMRSR